MLEICERLIGVSWAVRELRTDLSLAAASDTTVLISGERGAGKAIIARTIHQRSHRRDAVLTAINCTALPDSTLESRLFGLNSGTGADRDRRGWLELSEGGTVLLEEVDGMGCRVQAGLVKFLENGDTSRDGANGQPLHVNVRVIAATSSDLFEETTRRRFREDLYYRLNVIHLRIPPLRERGKDIAELLSYFLAFYSGVQQADVPHLTAPALRILESYDWPGNVRELRSFAERLVLHRSAVLTADQVRAELARRHLPQVGADGHRSAARAYIR